MLLADSVEQGASPFPDGWKATTVGAEAAVVSKGTTPTSLGLAFVDDGVTFMKIEAITGDGHIDRRKVSYIDDKTHRLLRRSQLRTDDVLFSIAGALGRSAVVGPEILPANINQALSFIRLRDQSPLDPRFLWHYLRSHAVVRQVEQINVQAAQANLSLRNVRDLVVPIPTPAEQDAICVVLDDIDALVRATERLIEKKRGMLQGSIQELLSTDTAIAAGWASHRLGDVATITMGRTPSREVASFWGHGQPWATIADMKSRLVVKTKEQVTNLAASRMTVVPKGTLMMSFKLTLGRVAFAGRDMFTNEAICHLRNPSVDPGFLYFALPRADFARAGAQAVKGYTLNQTSLGNLEIRCPTTADEQRAIAAILEDMEREITVLESTLRKTRDLKSALAHDLLSGRTRLP